MSLAWPLSGSARPSLTLLRPVQQTSGRSRGPCTTPSFCVLLVRTLQLRLAFQLAAQRRCRRTSLTVSFAPARCRCAGMGPDWIQRCEPQFSPSECRFVYCAGGDSSVHLHATSPELSTDLTSVALLSFRSSASPVTPVREPTAMSGSSGSSTPRECSFRRRDVAATHHVCPTLMQTLLRRRLHGNVALRPHQQLARSSW